LMTIDQIAFEATSRGNPYYVDQDTLAVTVYAIRGDASNDGVIDLGDVVHLINYLFRDGPAPEVPQTGDVNCDEVIDLGDVVYLINYLFRDGPLPCAP
ncbi:MAG: hypothetical protein KAW02_04105, partial [candidate division Zixibacteria bacterium]|nr:hypothetical protein [candidate division Zixibacteria bacterium]